MTDFELADGAFLLSDDPGHFDMARGNRVGEDHQT
jgi:hypothetical protein